LPSTVKNFTYGLRRVRHVDGGEFEVSPLAQLSWRTKLSSWLSFRVAWIDFKKMESVVWHQLSDGKRIA